MAEPAAANINPNLFDQCSLLKLFFIYRPDHLFLNSLYLSPQKNTIADLHRKMKALDKKFSTEIKLDQIR